MRIRAALLPSVKQRNLITNKAQWVRRKQTTSAVNIRATHPQSGGNFAVLAPPLHSYSGPSLLSPSPPLYPPLPLFLRLPLPPAELKINEHDTKQKLMSSHKTRINTSYSWHQDRFTKPPRSPYREMDEKRKKKNRT